MLGWFIAGFNLVDSLESWVGAALTRNPGLQASMATVRARLQRISDRPFAGDQLYLTVAVWVGFIALFGIAVDDGIVIGTYLDQTFRRRKLTRFKEIEERVIQAGLRRIRPTLAALAPVLLITGRGSDVMTPMALPVFGGMLIALISISSYRPVIARSSN